MGRPKKDFTQGEWGLIDLACQFKVEAQHVADLVDCSARTLSRRIDEKSGITFVQYRNKIMSKTLHNLFSKQYEVAMNGNTAMLIWLGKNYMGQTDKLDIDADINHRMNKSITILLKDCTDEELANKALGISDNIKKIDEL